jgi:hypothetical protein
MGNCDFRSVQNEDKDVVLDNNRHQSDNATKARTGAVQTFLDDNNEVVNEDKTKGNQVANNEGGPEQNPTFEFERNEEQDNHLNEKRQEVDEVIESNFDQHANNDNNNNQNVVNENLDDSVQIEECNHDHDPNTLQLSKTKAKIETINAKLTVNHA